MVSRKLALPLALVLTGFTARAEDWPQFRGPTGQGHSSERGVPYEWSETRNVSPMPSMSSAPMPTALLIEPANGVPASVTPRWSG